MKNRIEIIEFNSPSLSCNEVISNKMLNHDIDIESQTSFLEEMINDGDDINNDNKDYSFDEPSKLKFEIKRIPQISSFNNKLDWDSDFLYKEKRVDSSSCHIYAAILKNSSTNMHVIIKLLKSDRLHNQQALEEFEIESTVLSRISHPNIVTYIGSGVYAGKIPFICLEMLEGGTIAHSLGLRSDSNKRYHIKRYNFKETLIIARDIAGAFKYLHSEWNSKLRIIHRDLKPDNIGFTKDGRVKILDFGLCTVIANKDNENCNSIYNMTANTGTLRYMPPEVALGKPYNHKVDVYSYAILLWQISQNKIPYEYYTRKKYLSNVVYNGQRLSLNKNHPSQFNSLLSKCWDKDFTKRLDFDIIYEELNDLIKIIDQNSYFKFMKDLKLSVIYYLMMIKNSLTKLFTLKKKIIVTTSSIILILIVAIILSYELSVLLFIILLLLILISTFSLYVSALLFINGKNKSPFAKLELEKNDDDNNLHSNILYRKI